MKNHLVLSVIVISFSLFLVSLFLNKLHLFSDIAFAQERVESDNFRIQFPNLNSGAGIPTSSSYRLDSTLGQTAPGQYSSSGYRVKAGFEYIHSIIPFSFSISDIQKNFGILVPDNPSSSTSLLTVSAGGAGGYQVTATENHPLQTLPTLNTIPDTTCDSGLCTQTTASLWNNSTTYGFGYNMNGDDVPTAFINTSYFKQFSDLSLSELPQAVMSSINVGTSRTATITYKVNVSNLQPAGTYRNIITFTAIPGY